MRNPLNKGFNIDKVDVKRTAVKLVCAAGGGLVGLGISVTIGPLVLIGGCAYAGWKAADIALSIDDKLSDES